MSEPRSERVQAIPDRPPFSLYYPLPEVHRISSFFIIWHHGGVIALAGKLIMMLLLVMAIYGLARLAQDVYRSLHRQVCLPVSVLVLLQDREHEVEFFLRRLHRWQEKQWPELDVVVVDTGSRDQTPNILQRQQSRYNFHMICLTATEQQAGEGATLNTGLLYCRNTVVWLLDTRSLPVGALVSAKGLEAFFSVGWR